MSFDSTINTLIPWILVIVAVGWIWWKFNEPLKKLFGWLGGLFGSAKDKISQTDTTRVTRDIVMDY